MHNMLQILSSPELKSEILVGSDLSAISYKLASLEITMGAITSEFSLRFCGFIRGRHGWAESFCSSGANPRERRNSHIIILGVFSSHLIQIISTRTTLLENGINARHMDASAHIEGHGQQHASQSHSNTAGHVNHDAAAITPTDSLKALRLHHFFAKMYTNEHIDDLCYGLGGTKPYSPFILQSAIDGHGNNTSYEISIVSDSTCFHI